jgi:hypothetical protein
VTVRIVDDSRAPPSSVAAPASQSVDMIGDDGQKVGTVDVRTTGTAMAIDLSVAYGLADGDYHVWLARSGAGKQPVGTMHVSNGYGTWSDTVLATSGPAQLSLQDDQGRTRCSATLPAV